MKKTSLALLAAGMLAAAGFAQADAILHRDGTVVELDTSVLGAAPAASTATVTTVSVPQLVIVQPNAHLMHDGLSERERKQAAATFNVPARAGEASTMTNGVPNMITHNPTGSSMVVGSYSVPYTVVTPPYYIQSN